MWDARQEAIWKYSAIASEKFKAVSDLNTGKIRLYSLGCASIFEAKENSDSERCQSCREQQSLSDNFMKRIAKLVNIQRILNLRNEHVTDKDIKNLWDILYTSKSLMTEEG